MNPLVTISIPLYKCEDFLNNCLESVLAQSYQNIEVTLINDHTPDKSVEIAEQFILKNNLFKSWRILHLEENSGLSVVRNKGIDTANGKYIFFLDSDDTITSNAIEKMVNISEMNQTQMVIGEVEGIRYETGEHFDVFPLQLKNDVIKGNDEIFLNFIDGGYPVSSWNKLILLEFLKENRLYFVKGLYAQDNLHSFDVAQKLESIAVLREVTYHYYLHKNSVIHNRNKKHFDNWATIVSYMNEAIKNCSTLRIPIIKKHIINYKTMTLVMNWKAQKDDELWMYSYNRYKETPNLSFSDFFSSKYNLKTKKNAIKLELPAKLALQLFKRSYNS